MMGRIKTQQVKRVTEKLMELHADEFSKDYEKNKEILARFADIPSRKLRNVIAGYVTRLKKMAEK